MFQNGNTAYMYYFFLFSLMIKDLPCTELWKKHVQKRWNFWSRVGHVGSTYSTVFSDSERSEDFHKVYLIKHFLDLLNYCCLNVHVPGKGCFDCLCRYVISGLWLMSNAFLKNLIDFVFDIDLELFVFVKIFPLLKF